MYSKPEVKHHLQESQRVLPVRSTRAGDSRVRLIATTTKGSIARGSELPNAFPALYMTWLVSSHGQSDVGAEDHRGRAVRARWRKTGERARQVAGVHHGVQSGPRSPAVVRVEGCSGQCAGRQQTP